MVAADLGRDDKVCRLDASWATDKINQ